MLTVLAAIGLAGESIVAASAADSPSDTTYSFFKSADVTKARTTYSDNRSAIEVGLRFSSTATGALESVRFLKAREDAAQHRVTVWSANGAKLASTLSANESSSGWQEVALPQPVQLQAGQWYIVSYQTTRYRVTKNYFTSGLTAGPLSLGSNPGVYSTTAGQVPSQSGWRSNYWVDLVFRPAATAPAPTATQTSASPSPTATTTTPPTSSPTPTASPTSSGPSTSPTSPSLSTSSTASPTNSPSPTQSTGGFPNATNTGVPTGWTPIQTYTSDVRVTTPGAVVRDIRIVNADLVIAADNVTVRRVEIQGGAINTQPGATCSRDTLIEDTSVVRAPGQLTSGDWPAVYPGGYTARRVRVEGLPEGFRVGGRSVGCGPIAIEDSFAHVVSPDVCGDWHGDALQGYDGPAVTVRNTTLHLDQRSGCGGTAPFFYPASQGNTRADIAGLLVVGGGFPFRLGMPATVTGLRIAAGSWAYGPIEVACSKVTSWEARVVSVDSSYQPIGSGTAQACNTSG